MKQYPGSRDHGDPDSRSQQPEEGRRFGGGLHGLPRGDIAVDPEYPSEPHPPGITDSDLMEAEKDRFRAQTETLSDAADRPQSEREARPASTAADAESRKRGDRKP